MSRRKGAARAKPAPIAVKNVSKPLTSKENTHFLEALKLYEGKQFKKSIKLLDGILKKNAKNPDTLALKGLNLQFLGEQSEGSIYMTQAIKLIEGTHASAICCHVMGIYMKATKDYVEAIKWFQASMDNGSANQQIYRDLASLQSQIGDYKNALVSRKKYWESFLGYRANWTALAIAQDLNGERQQAVNTLSQFEKMADGKITDAEKFEHSECLIYKNDIMYRNAGSDKDKLEKVLKHLNDIEPKISDKYSVLEKKANIYMKMGQFKEASIVYRTLIKRNPDNFHYYKLLEVSLGIKNNNKLRKLLYEKLSTFYPRCEPPKFIPLTFIKDEGELSKKLEAYVIPQLNRGVPATFSNVKPLYQKRSQLVPKLIETIVLSHLESINVEESPVPYIWTCYFLAQHFLFLKNFTKAQEYIDMAIKHTPTLVEFYILKGRIFKHQGELVKAAEVVDEGRQLDLQDRFINCKSVKYYLRANNIEKAVEVVSLFTKNENSVNGVKDLHLVEAAWFIVEQAEAYYRLYLDESKRLITLNKELTEVDEKDEAKKNDLALQVKDCTWNCNKYQGLSIKRFTAISKFYQQFEDDKLDFHSYCMRKGTPRAYLDMLKWGDKIYTKPMYVRSMEGASKIYFEIDTNQKVTQAKIAQGEEPVIISNKQLKKEAAALHKRQEQEKKSVMAYSEDQDNDPFGDKMIHTKHPLREFDETFYSQYNKQVRDDERDCLLDFEYNYRIGKSALCLGSMSKLNARIPEGSSPQASAIIAVMATILLKAAKEGQFDEVAKMVALKSLETQYNGLISLEQTDFQEFNDLAEKYPSLSTNLIILQFMYRFPTVFDQTKVKSMIINAAATLDPYGQFQILNYTLV
ncbi:N-terminal acetyltransferase A complex subunit Nat1p [Monosporozyma servazzii]